MFNQIVQLVCVLTISVNLAGAVFTPGFQHFLNKTYGPVVAQQLARNDLGQFGSFGGANSTHEFDLRRNPLILFHGLGSYASVMLNASTVFAKLGYKNDSLFATSYGPNGSAIGVQDTLLCAYVKQVRTFILAVHKYTGRKVNIAAYSMGSTISRKAILGGLCVDTQENLGGPLTSIVDRYLSIVGANLGHILCLKLSSYPMCNNVTGLFPNSSLFIQDINHVQHYEGKDTYLIASLTDDSVGFAQELLHGANINVTISGFTHIESHFRTLNSQYELLTKGYLDYPTLDLDLVEQEELTGKNTSGSIQEKPRHRGHGH